MPRKKKTAQAASASPGPRFAYVLAFLARTSDQLHASVVTLRAVGMTEEASRVLFRVGEIEGAMHVLEEHARKFAQLANPAPDAPAPPREKRKPGRPKKNAAPVARASEASASTDVDGRVLLGDGDDRPALNGGAS